MPHIIEAMPRPIRRRLKKIVQKTADKDYARRAQALLHLAAGCSVTEAAARLFAARSSLGRWRTLYARIKTGLPGFLTAVRHG